MAHLQFDREPSDLEYAIAERVMLNVCPFGPLTLDEHESVRAYEQHHEESEAEYEAQHRARGRTICPQCGERSVTHRSVLTYGHASHPESEYSDLASCERCDYRAL